MLLNVSVPIKVLYQVNTPVIILTNDIEFFNLLQNHRNRITQGVRYSYIF